MDGADDIVNQRAYLNELKLDDPLSISRMVYRQSVVATAMMIAGVNRVVVRDLDVSDLSFKKRATPLALKFKILIELAKKLNYEVSIIE